MKIRVGIPFYSEFEDAKKGVHELVHIKEHSFYIEPRQGVLIGRLRNSFVNDYKSQKKRQEPLNFDAFLFVDSDISFTAADAMRLIKADKDIISGVYRSQKDEKYECGLFHPAIPGKVMTRFNSMTRGLRKVDFCGGGFLFVKRAVFEYLEYPWFRHMMVSEGDYQEESGEDYGFAVNAANSNIEIWTDFDCEVNHRIREYSDFRWSLT